MQIHEMIFEHSSESGTNDNKISSMSSVSISVYQNSEDETT